MVDTGRPSTSSRNGLAAAPDVFEGKYYALHWIVDPSM
jgi:hypothetical protein